MTESFPRKETYLDFEYIEEGEHT